MPAEKTVPAAVWEKLTPEQKAKRFASTTEGYAFTDFFVYERHPSLPEYTLNKKGGPVPTGYYMIDFKMMCRVNCDLIRSPQDSPIDAKVLELSIEARADLRNKIVAFFARNPDEKRL